MPAPVEAVPAFTADDPEQAQVLIVEDNPDVIAYLSAVLGPQYQLLTAMDGQAGLDLAREKVPDLIVSDVMMPGMDGFALTEALKTDARTSHIPVILLTAKAMQADKVEGLSHGADAYLSKPFDQAELLIRIEKLLALRKTLQARYQGFVKEAEPAIPAEPTLDDIFLDKIRTVIIERLDKPDLSVHDLCDVVHLARTQVYRKVKALTGLTPTLLIRSIRLEKGKTLLEQTQLTVSEIAYDVGFSDPNYFSRIFAKTYGKRPSNWREETV